MSFIIDTDNFFFEQREKGGANGALGKIGCWGGQLKPNENALTAVHREVTKKEVKGLESFKPVDFEQLSHQPMEVMSDRDGRPQPIIAHVFRLLLPIGYRQRISAPNSIWINTAEYLAAFDAGKLTPATDKASIDYLGLVKKDMADGLINN